MNIRILRAAVEDLAAGRRFYEERQAGAGDYFTSCMFAEIDALVIHAGCHRIIRGYHRIVTRKFPYSIYYKMSGPEPVVHRILDCRRNPRWISKELKQDA
jgi:hypothetical protein